MARRRSPTVTPPRVIMPNALEPRIITQTRVRRVTLKRPIIVKRPVVQTTLQQVEDRRRWHPLRKLAPAGTLSRRDQRRLVEKSRPNPFNDPFPSFRIGFEVPKKVAVCVRRKTRREVIHALGKTGSGAKARRRKSEFTNVRC